MPGKEIVATFPDLTYLPGIENVRPLSKIVIDEYLEKKFERKRERERERDGDR